MKTPILFALVLWSGITVAAGQAHWPQWRGPSGDGSLPEGKTPTEFGPGKNLKWQTELPGRGCSTPVAWGDTIFLTGPDGDEDAVMAFGLDGKEKWRKTVGEAMAGKKGRTGSSANSSPLTDGERVYAFFKSGNVAALTMAGELLWSTNIWKEYGENKLWWDNGTSPVLAGGNLVIDSADFAPGDLCLYRVSWSTKAPCIIVRSVALQFPEREPQLPRSITRQTTFFRAPALYRGFP